MPGPVCVDSTGPTSLTNTGSHPNTSRQRSISASAWSGAEMCWTTQPSAPDSWRWRA